MSKISTAVVAAAITFAVATPASATDFTVIGGTTGGPVFHRTLAGTPPTALSGVGTAVHYNTFLFSVPGASSYDFLLTSLTSGYDPFLSLYVGVFNPAAPLSNVLIANDDLTPGDFTHSGFQYNLSANTIYTVVISGFNNADFGRYNLFITNHDADPSVPEPATWALMLAGFGMVGYGLRRKQSVRVTYA